MYNFKAFIQGFKDEMETVVSDHSVLLTVIAAPLVYVFLMGSIYFYKEVNRIPFAVVDLDHTHTTMELTRQLAAHPAVRIIDMPTDARKAMNDMYNLKIQGFVVFPKGFEKHLLKGEGGDVKLYLNNNRFLPSNDLNRAVNTIFMTVGSGIRLHYFAANGLNPKYAMQLINPVMADVHGIYNPTNNYGDFLLPGLLFLILQQTLLIGLAESFVRSREKGRLKQILSQDATGIFSYFSGRTGYYLLLYTGYILLYFGIIFRFFDLPIRGDKVAMYGMGILFILVVAVYTLLIASFSKKQIRIMEVLAFTSYPLFLLSGYSWPVSAMPLPLQWLSAIIPTTPMLDAVTRLFAEGSGWQAVTDDFVQLLLMLFFALLLLMGRLAVLKKQFSRQTEIPDKTDTIKAVA